MRAPPARTKGATDMADHEPGKMDITEQEKTFGLFLKNWIFFHLVLDFFIQFHTGQLQQFDRLLELWRHHQLLCEL